MKKKIFVILLALTLSTVLFGSYQLAGACEYVWVTIGNPNPC